MLFMCIPKDSSIVPLKWLGAAILAKSQYRFWFPNLSVQHFPFHSAKIVINSIKILTFKNNMYTVAASSETVYM